MMNFPPLWDRPGEKIPSLDMVAFIEDKIEPPPKWLTSPNELHNELFLS